MLLLSIGANAETLSPEAALSRALPAARRIASATPSELTLKYTETIAKSETPALYIFSDDDKYLVVSADDNADALLGYADVAFDKDNIPPAMKWWLEEYAAQIALAGKGNAAPAYRVEREAIAPMVKTLWDQDAPYNNACPTIGGQKSVTGCVATASAQVMNYHQWPLVGQGSNSYRIGLQRISMDFSKTEFDWANMLDNYRGVNASQKEIDAVATLMFACGVASNMQYSSTASGTTDVDALSGLVKYFNYDKGARYLARAYYGITEWEELVYKQLKEYGPVQYSGQSNEGGHSFVCDGYSTDGYFHFNWGWGGMSDGYFRLTALDPGQQGIGGSLSGFNFGQSILANLCKPKEGSVMYENLMATDAFNISQSLVRVGSFITVTSTIANFSYDTLNGIEMGIKMVDENGEVSYHAGSAVDGIRPGYGFANYSVVMPPKEAGTYIISPAFKNSRGEWQEVPVKRNTVKSYSAKLLLSRYSLTPITEGSVEIKNLALETKLYLNQAFKMSADVENTGDTEYYMAVRPALVNGSNKIVALGEVFPIDLKVGENQKVEYMSKFTEFPSSTPEAGTYNLCLVNYETLEPVSDTVEVEVNASATSFLTVSGFTIEGGTKDVDAGNIHFTATVRCRLGYFGGSLEIAIFPDEVDAYSVAVMTANPMFLSSGQSDELSVVERFNGAEIGKTYLAVLFNGSTQIGAPISFTVTRNSSASLNDIETSSFIAYPNPTYGKVNFSEEAAQVNVYNMAGGLVLSENNVSSIDLSDADAGIYIAEILPADGGERIIRRIIKR